MPTHHRQEATEQAFTRRLQGHISDGDKHTAKDQAAAIIGIKVLLQKTKQLVLLRHSHVNVIAHDFAGGDVR